MITFSRLGKYGQLGNQLFQYALLLGVAAKTGRQIKIPKTFRGIKKQNQVELEPFKITAGELNGVERAKIRHRYQEASMRFDPAVFAQQDNCDYAGYFQTELYFKDIRPTVLKEFTFRQDILEWAASAFSELRRGTEGIDIVALHVRRGDYLEHPELFRVLTPDYYQAARAELEKKLRKPLQYLVFSDDIAWCNENLEPPFRVSPGKSHWEDLALLSLCDHFIIGASTFGWWGAWLAQCPEKQVIAPDPWFGPENTADTTDLVPASWMKLHT